jgi:hypothetical protein
LFDQLSASQGIARYQEDFIILPVMLGDLDLGFDAANRSLDEFPRLGTVKWHGPPDGCDLLGARPVCR